MAAMQGKDLYNPISFGKDLLAGSVVAAISKTVVVPTEHVKLLLQVQASSKQIEAEQQYKGMVDCFMRIPREQGFFSFWCGNLANVIRYFPMQALKFAFKDKYKQIFVSKVDKEKQVLLSDSSRDLMTVLLKLQIHTDFLACTRVLGFQCRESLSTKRPILDVMTPLRDYCQIQNKQTPFILSFFIVQVVTTCSGMLSYPFDTVRRHMMMQSGETECQYKGTVDCFMKIYKSERGLMLSSVEHSPASFVEQEER